MSEPSPVRRMEIFTGSGRRRTWLAEQKAQIVAESYAGSESVCAVARRHGLLPTQLFSWRRAARRSRADEPALSFAPVVVESAASVATAAPKRPKAAVGLPSGVIEVEIDGMVVRVGRGAEAETIAAVIRALKAAR